MDINELLKNVEDLSDLEFKRKLNNFVRSKSDYKNLSPENREVILNIIDEYKDILKEGRKIDYNRRNKDYYKLKKNKIKLGLTDEDLKDIKKIIDWFK